MLQMPVLCQSQKGWAQRDVVNCIAHRLQQLLQSERPLPEMTNSTWLLLVSSVSLICVLLAFWLSLCQRQTNIEAMTTMKFKRTKYCLCKRRYLLNRLHCDDVRQNNLVPQTHPS